MPTVSEDLAFVADAFADENKPSRIDPKRITDGSSNGVGGFGRRRGRDEKLYGTVDLGTNNCRLLIAEPSSDGFRVVDAFSRVVRLGEGLAANGVLTDAAQSRAIAALKICAEKLTRKEVRMARHVATQACRQAANCQDFVSRTFNETGLHLDVITPAEEARLAVLGCQELLDPTIPHALIFDIGGGSTEVAAVRIPEGRVNHLVIEGWMSIPWGVVSLAEVYGGRYVTRAGYQAMMAEIGAYLGGFGPLEEIDPEQLQILGTSGTVTTLASLHLGLLRYDRHRVDGCRVAIADMQRIAQRLRDSSYEERLEEPCIGKDRADLVIAGCAVLEAIFNHLQPIAAARTIRIADRGIREGVLRMLIQRDRQRYDRSVSP